MRQMEAKFSFFKAGQGSFYGGRIWEHETNRVFTVVYDCGTSPFIKGNNESLNNEITYFKHRAYYPYNNDEIELLFISHLDYDHVSGLKRLLTEFKVKNIILPYIDKKYRQFFLASISDNNDPVNNLSVEDYISFIESPNQFIIQNSEDKETQVFFVKSNDKNEIEYQGYDSNNESQYVYPRGTLNTDTEELIEQEGRIAVYENNLQFFIRRKWEFTTYVQSVNKKSIDKLHACLKKKLHKKTSESLTLDDLKHIVTTNRKESHKCYIDCIGDINSHGLVLLHGPIRFEHICSRIYSENKLHHHFYDDEYHRPLYDDIHIENNNPTMLGTLLFGDTSINPSNNPINFPPAFKDKLVNVHVVQVPHHGSSKNWDITKFEALNIGKNIRWGNHLVTVCNFGYGNKFGHPSHEVLDELSSTIFLNTQFSRLTIRYHIILHRP